jgi:hypothetical protein
MSNQRISDLNPHLTLENTDLFVVVNDSETKNITFENIKVAVEENFILTVDLMDELTVDFYAPFDMKIISVENVRNTPTNTIEVEEVAYVLEDPIDLGDKITVEMDVNGVVNLLCQKIVVVS